MKDLTQFMRYRDSRSGSLVLGCVVGRSFMSAVLYDTALSRRYARAVRFGAVITQENAVESVNALLMRLLRESSVPGNAVRRIGFAAPADITMALEERFDPSELYLPPDSDILILPMMSAAAGGELTAVLACALSEQGSVLAADSTGGFRAVSYADGRLRFACLPLKGGFDGTGLETGMPLENGAIDSLSRESDGTICYSVIGDGEGMGVAPSAAAQAAEIMLKTGALDSDGIMTDRDLFYIGEDHYVSQQDIRALQSDKAAFGAALERLGEITGRHDRFVASGEIFGCENGAAAAARLGAVPRGLAEKYGWSRLPAEQGLICCLTVTGLSERLSQLCTAAEDITPLVYEGFDEFYVKKLAF